MESWCPSPYFSTNQPPNNWFGIALDRSPWRKLSPFSGNTLKAFPNQLAMMDKTSLPYFRGPLSRIA